MQQLQKTAQIDPRHVEPSFTHTVDVLCIIKARGTWQARKRQTYINLSKPMCQSITVTEVAPHHIPEGFLQGTNDRIRLVKWCHELVVAGTPEVTEPSLQSGTLFLKTSFWMISSWKYSLISSRDQQEPLIKHPLKEDSSSAKQRVHPSLRRICRTFLPFMRVNATVLPEWPSESAPRYSPHCIFRSCFTRRSERIRERKMGFALG